MEKYYVCPKCDDLTTKSQLEIDVSNGGMGMCICKWMSEHRVYIPYKEITSTEYERRKKCVKSTRK